MEQPRPAVDHVVVGDSDPLTSADLRDLAERSSGPKVSIHLPTHRKGRDVRQDPVQLRNLLDQAAAELSDAGGDPATTLGPARGLLDDADFWQHQCDGLSLFASAEVCRWFRVPLSHSPSVTVGDTFHVGPLVPLLAGEGEFLVLALSQNSVRLFSADRHSITELDTGPVPTSMAEALAHEDPERQLQGRSVGSGDLRFHGHGVGEHDKGEVERFLRAVDHGLTELLGADPRPIVLACVGYYVPIFRSVTRHADVVEPAVEGNPEHLKASELHDAAWARLEARHAQHLEATWSRYDAALGNEHAAATLSDANEAAAQGRVDTLFVTDRLAAVNGTSLELVNRAILATLTTSGRVLAVNADRLPTDEPAVALLRY